MAEQKLLLGLVFLALMSCSWCLGPEKNIVFYMHDIVSKPNSTATVVAGVKGTSSNLLGFGTVLVIDDLLTEKPDRSSTVEYNGSTLEIQGTDPFMQSSEKEVSVVGGTGKLRYARGYAIITLQSSSGLDGNIKFNTTFCIG
ncbi:dirigent protein 1 [Cryptomeria japonica]|uniref:dirigent protein 1 n=1 Tax=Cryptomeria japonica TaxID=3369 RepID=UPI0025AD6C27|nr:dirigent protein 1 [Cryptomeria japonica]